MTLDATEVEHHQSSLSSSFTEEKSEGQRGTKFAQNILAKCMCFYHFCILSPIRTKYAVEKITGKPKDCVRGVFPMPVGRNTHWQFLEGARLT